MELYRIPSTGDIYRFRTEEFMEQVSFIFHQIIYALSVGIFSEVYLLQIIVNFKVSPLPTFQLTELINIDSERLAYPTQKKTMWNLSEQLHTASYQYKIISEKQLYAPSARTCKEEPAEDFGNLFQNESHGTLSTGGASIGLLSVLSQTAAQKFRPWSVAWRGLRGWGGRFPASFSLE